MSLLFFPWCRCSSLFSFLQKKKSAPYRVRPEQHLPGEAVALLSQRDVADACFCFLGFKREARGRNGRERK